MLKMLCVTAHPDDEAGAFGGSLPLYRDRGVETHLICLTPGQAATNRGTARSNDELAELRRAELSASATILRISHVEVLDYPDSRLDRVDLYPVVGYLCRRVREIRPHIVLTIGLEGAVTGHPDHSMAGLFTTMAFHWAGRADRYREQLAGGLEPHRTQKLYYATASFTLPDRPPVSLPPVTTTIDIRQYLETKLSAFRAHATQGPLFPLFEKSMRARGNEELFHLAAVDHPSMLEPETDLFARVTE
jgi:LmbE family N-acetylglucosaminyl deacetylase